MADHKHLFHVQGMHCKACGILITDKLSEVPGVKRVHVDDVHNTAEVVVENDAAADQIARELSALIKKDGYTLTVQKTRFVPKWSEFTFAVPIAIAFSLVFYLLQKMGLVNLISAENVNFSAAFGIGLVASVSSCLAVVGGLLLSVSAQYSKEGEKSGPQILFHAGRLVSFFLLGGVIGLIGSAFTLSGVATLILGTLVGLIMLSLGINLLDVFPWAKYFQPHMPAFLTRFTKKTVKMEHDLVPLLIGASTFFLPCGFTQSMQVYSLTTGTFIGGATTMFAFALGTLPVLALISFTSMELGKGKWSGVFFKTAGLLVVAFGIMNIVNSLAAAGIIRPVFGF